MRRTSVILDLRLAAPPRLAKYSEPWLIGEVVRAYVSDLEQRSAVALGRDPIDGPIT